MSKKAFKSQASSSRAGTSSPFPSTAFGSPASKAFGGGFGGAPSSRLACVYEPPDLTVISDAGVVVSLKNVQKKDSTTKAKALEELLAFVQELETKQTRLEEAVIEAWIQLYPRVSIDNARRVRQAAHALQGQISIVAGKGIAKHMPAVVGAWLCGMNDNDKLVVRAAAASFQSVFPTPEKRSRVWTAFQGSILTYLRDAILNETVTTLSDLRTVTKDDAEAKYARVLGAAVSTLVEALGVLSQKDLSQEAEHWQELISNDGFWKNCAFEDAFVRRGIFRLLSALLEKVPDLLDVRAISQHLIYDATKSDLTGSATDYIKALHNLTQKHPDVWTTNYSGSGKKSATRGLCHLLRKGSHGASTEYWATLASLLQLIPEEVILLEKTPNESRSEGEKGPGEDILSEMVTGISRKEDRRLDNRAAWTAYLKLASRIIACSEDAKTDAFCQSHVLPLVIQHISPSNDTLQWTVNGDAQKICTQSLILCCKASLSSAQVTVQQLSTGFVERLNTSLPEQSKEYAKSQDTIIKESQRWYSLLRALLEDDEIQPLREIATKCLKDEQSAAIDVLSTRNGKPYSAAAVLDIQARIFSSISTDGNENLGSLLEFAQNKVPQLVTSPSAPYLFRLLDQLRDVQGIQKVYEECLKTLQDSPDNSGTTQALKVFVASPWPQYEQAQVSLKAIIKRSLESSLLGQQEDWSLVRASLGNASIPAELTEEILSTMVDSLSISEKSSAGLDGLELALQENGSAVRAYLLSEKGANLIAKLLFLSQSPDAVGDQAAKLKSATDRLIAASGSGASASGSIIEVIRAGVLDTGHMSITIDSLVTQARQVFKDAAKDKQSEISSKLLPEEPTLRAILDKYTQTPPNSSLSLTNMLHGAIYLVQTYTDIPQDSVPDKEFDLEGYSSLIRVVTYCLRLLEDEALVNSLSTDSLSDTCEFLALCNQLIADNLNLASYAELWDATITNVEHDVLEAVTDLQADLGRWLSTTANNRPEYYSPAVNELFQSTAGDSPSAYYSARAYASFVGEELSRHGYDSSTRDDSRLGTIRKSADVIQARAYLCSVLESSAVLKVCNEMMSDLSGTDLAKDSRRGLERLVLLNALFDVLDERKEDLPQQRLVFFVKHILPFASQGQCDSTITAEVLKVLNQILPLLKDLFGEFWSESLTTIVRQLSASDDIPVLHAALRLLGAFRSLIGQDASEDIEESWEEQKEAIGSSLTQLLSRQSKLHDTTHQPRKMVNELLARQLEKSQVEFKGELSELFPVMNSPSVAIQSAAYAILSTKIPQLQEQASMDAALSKDFVPKLPEELFSLLEDVPETAEFLDLGNASDLPASIYRYLLSWKLVFTHWESASYALQSAYVDALKETPHVDRLLALTFDVLIARRAKGPVDPSKFSSSIETWSALDAAGDDASTQAAQLLTHLYYLTLVHLPGLAKTWWRNACPRALEKKVEEWTARWVSGLVAGGELAAVAAWEPNPDSTTELEVRVAMRAREVTARYPIDEQHLAMRIALPPAYPLQPAGVSTVARVGVDEKRWASWLNTSAIAINFAAASQGRGALVDGLVAFRRNVAGQLKGQSECAICYSVVSADRQLPSKRCATCKNQFHGSCLFRWFRSSSSSSCPLCRNAFNYA